MTSEDCAHVLAGARPLPNRHLDLGDQHLAFQAGADLVGRVALEKQSEGLLQVVARLLDGVPLAGDIKLGTQRDIPRALALDDGRQFLVWLLPVRRRLRRRSPN